MKKTGAFRALALMLVMVFLAGGVYLPKAAPIAVTVSAADEGEFYVPARCPYVLEGEYLKDIEINTTVGELKYYYGDAEITVKNSKNKTLAATAKLATGYTLTVKGQTVTLVVKGDANGDGVGGEGDAEIAKALLMNAEGAAAYAEIATELTGDGILSTADYLNIKHLQDCQLLVQSAPTTVSVPNLSGMTEKQARDALQNAGLKADVRYTTEGTMGKVAYQKTAAGYKAGEGATISVVVTSDGMYTPINYDRMKGIWLYQYITGRSLFKESSSSQRSESSYRSLVQGIINNMTRDGFNTVLLQMRPYGDALYPSEVYPPSPYVCAASGTSYNGTFTYDPLEVFLEIAHESGISVHAWLNPMRLMTTGTISTVSTEYRLGQWYRDSSKNGTYIVANGGRYYLNPAYPETRQLVIDGIMEICENYDIDGIHFDDYFYISIDSTSTDLAFDQAAFNQYGSSYGSASSLSVRKEFRRQQVNTLVRDIYTAMHEYDDDLVFGISPAGNIDNNQTGYLCADVRTWCSTPGYVDYICPQVYWSFEYSWNPAKFDVCTEAWADMCTADEVDLVIGIPTYRANESYSSTDPGWGTYDDNIAKMLNYLKNHDRASGWVFFKYESTYDIYSGGYTSSMMSEINNYIGLIKNW